MLCHVKQAAAIGYSIPCYMRPAWGKIGGSFWMNRYTGIRGRKDVSEVSECFSSDGRSSECQLLVASLVMNAISAFCYPAAWGWVLGWLVGMGEAGLGGSTLAIRVSDLRYVVL